MRNFLKLPVRWLIKGMGFFLLGVFCAASGQESARDSTRLFSIPWKAISIPIAHSDIRSVKELQAVVCDSGVLGVKVFPQHSRDIQRSSSTDSSGELILFKEKWQEVEIALPEQMPIMTYFEKRSEVEYQNTFLKLAREYKKEGKKGGQTEKVELIGANIAGQRVSLRVSGNINITGKVQRQQQSLVQATAYSTKNTFFRIDQKQQFNIEGKIGDRISVLVDQDSERDFDFENNLRIIYTGHEDDIVQKVEAGNVSLSLPSTNFVTFSGRNQGLFGLKSLMRLGGLDITSIASIERGRSEKIKFEGGTQSEEKIIKDIDYRRRTYFFLDETFRKNFYPLVNANSTHVVNPNYVVDEIEVYKRLNTGTQEVGSFEGKAWIDPNDHNLLPDYMEQGLFIRLDREKDYTVNQDLGFIRFNSPLQDNDVIGVAYRVTTSDDRKNTVVSYGDWDRSVGDTSELELKLLKPENLLPDHPLWNLEFKNVYYLGASGINQDGFDLRIVYTLGRTENDDRDEKGVSFLQLFGLDSLDENGNVQPDDKPDIQNIPIFDFYHGELFFPFLEPFMMEKGDSDEFPGRRNPNIKNESYSCPAIYEANPNDRQALNADHKFNIVVQYKNRSSTVNLGPMVIENSEEVTLDGNPLVKNVDYSIDYFSGMLTFLTPAATNPNADLEIKYQKNQFFQLDKKTILGTRAQYDFGERSFIGATALYYNQSVIDEKVDVGYEPMRNFVWDVNTRLDFQMDYLTRALNWLPVIETDKPSNLAIEGEIAQVLPNPNSLNNPRTGDKYGVAFIDDFEGSKRTTSPAIIRRYWNKSSAPIGKRENQRGYFYWFNPYGGVLTTDIWPNKQTSVRAQNKFTDILTFVLEPNWSIDVVDGVSQPSDAWGGVTYSFPASYYDQSKSKFIEVWLKGDKGRFHIDLGYISEDQNGNGKLDTEDRKVDGFRNNLLDKGEDVGLDGVPDSLEFIVNNFGDTLRYGNDSLKKYNRDPDDPHGDNWSYKEGSANYRRTNGTEGNSRDVSGNYPDTEDLTRDYNLNDKNAYFTFDFDLSDPSLVAGKTSKGWKLFRIPLYLFRKEVEGSIDIDWQQIHFCRIWIDGAPSQDVPVVVSLAKIELVGNEWEELGVARNDSSEFVQDDEEFAVTVINSEENPDRYTSPKGVEGEYDRINEIRAKEQSLVMWFDGKGLPPGTIAAAEKDLLELQDYTQYKELKLYIYGNNVHDGTGRFISEDYAPLEFFLRIGNRGEFPKYYEVTKLVEPEWGEQLVVDLDKLTRLKNVLQSDSTQHITVYNEGEVRRIIYDETDQNGNPTGVSYKVVGEPALNRVNYLVVGLRNRNKPLNIGEIPKGAQISRSLFGEVWVDELRLSRVRRDKGIAMRARMSLNIADIGNIGVSIDRKDADFHTADKRLGSNNSSENLSLNARFNLNKFLPQEWGFSIPVTAQYSQNVSTPKYVPGSDILTGDAPPDSLLKQNYSRGVSASVDKTTHSDFWLVKYTIDEISGSFNAKWSQGSDDLIKKTKSETYNGNVSYSIPFGRDNYIAPFGILKDVKYVGKILGDFKVYYLPSSFGVKMSGTESIGEKISRKGNNYTPSYSFNINRSFDFKYKIFDNLNVSFSKTMKSNMEEFRGRKYDAVKELNPGIITNVSESYSANFNPKLISWFTPNFTYSSNYRWSEPANSQTPYVDALSNQNRLSANVNLSLKSVMESFYTPPRQSSGRSTRPAGRRPGGRRPGNKEPQQTKETGKKSDGNKVLLFLYKGLSKIKPVSFSWSVNNSIANNGRYGTAPFLYRIGFQPDPELPIDTINVVQNVDNISRKRDYSIRSGIDITSNIITSFSHSNSRTKTIGQGGRTTTNSSMDYFPLGSDGSRGFPFFGWSVRISGLQKIKFLSKIFSNISLDHTFNGKQTIILQNGEETSSSYLRNMAPMIGISTQFKNGISASVRLNQGLQINNNQGGTDKAFTKNYSATASYQHRGGLKIPIFFFRDFDLQNNIQFSFSLDYTENLNKGRYQEGSKFSVTRKNNSIRIKPQISYSFTRKVTGGIFFEYRENNDQHTGKHITRDYGFDVNIAIRG